MGLELTFYPNPILRCKAVDADWEMPGVRKLADSMIDYCKIRDVHGLAASQVQVDIRLVVLNTSGVKDDFVAWINPEMEIVDGCKELRCEESCLSLPGIDVKVIHPDKIKVRATNIDGEQVEMELEGKAARIWQHEIDHTNGKLLIDHLGSASVQMIKSKLKRLEKWRKKNRK